MAKLLVLSTRDVPWSVWTPIAYLWQDALLALVLSPLALVPRKRKWIAWSFYGLITAYAALNVPVARALSSPLTWRMWQAADPTLGDSIRHHLNLTNLVLIALVFGTSLALPRRLKRCSRSIAMAASLAALLLIALGPMATARVDTLGLHRNALIALTGLGRAHLPPPREQRDWRHPTLGELQAEDLSRYRGAAAGRNVVLILLESTGARYLRPYGDTNDPMPNLTRLSEHSIVFENAYAVYPESIKGLFTVLCSRYPAFDAQPEALESVRTRALAQVLKEAGFHTALFHSGRFQYLGMASVIRDRGFDVLEDAGAISGQLNSSFGVEEPATVRRMLAWIDALPQRERFFLTYLPIAGHHPYEAPQAGPFPNHEEMDRYRNALHYGDAALGQFLDGLRSRGLDTNTLFVVFGDHGEAFGQHEGNYGHTQFIYEENVHVPYLIAAPGLIDRNIRVAQVISLIDTAPTVLDLLGLAAPPDYQGFSLLTGQARAALFFTDYALGLLGLREGRWKFIHELDSGRSKLYDLAQDPAEQHNLAAQFPAQVAACVERVRGWGGAQQIKVQKFSSSVLRYLCGLL